MDTTTLQEFIDAVSKGLTELYQESTAPGVWRQLLVLAGIVLLAWLLAKVARKIQRHLVRRTNLPKRLARYGASFRQRLGNGASPEEMERRLERGLRRFEGIYWPLLVLVLLALSVALFEANLWRPQVLRGALILVRLLLLYQLGASLLYMLLDEQNAASLERAALRPLFLILVVIELQASFIAALLVLYLAWVLSGISQHILRTSVLPRAGANAGVANTVATLTRYVIVIVGILVALSILGIDLTSLAFVAGGLAVGIGFGMQKLVANFVSGLLLLFEQSIRPGDVVEVDGQIGVVEQLRIRATVVRTYDNVEVVVPNENLFTSTVTTFTGSERQQRVRLPVGASYNSDPKVVREALLQATHGQDLVLVDPPPTVFFIGYGDSSIDFELAVWVADPITIPRLRSDLYFAIWEEFEKRDIEIPFPQRDLHVRSGVPWDELRSPARMATDGEG
jgi:small-conductance mechanosensitive channel